MEISQLFASPYVQMTLLVVIIGVALRTWSGMIGRPRTSIKANLIAHTSIIAVLTSIPVIMPTFQAIPADTTAESWFVAVVMGILAVAGADSLAKKGAARLKGSEKKDEIGGMSTSEFDELDKDGGPPH